MGNMIAMVVVGGLSVSGRRALADEEASTAGIVGRATQIALMLCFLVGVLAGVLILPLMTSAHDLLSSLLLGVFAIAHGSQFVSIAALYGRERYHSAIWISTVYSLAQVGLVVLLKTFGVLTFTSAVVIYVASTLVLALLLRVQVRRVLGPALGATWRVGLGFYLRSFKDLAGVLNQSFMQSTERILVGAFAGNTAVAVFVAGVSLRMPVLMAQTAAAQVTITEATRGMQRPIRTNLPVFFAVLGIATFMFIAAPWLVPVLYGEDFIEAVPVSRLALATGIVMFLSGTLSAHYQGSGAHRRVTIVFVASVISTVVLVSTMSARAGAFGASLGVLLTSVVVLICWMVSASQRPRPDKSRDDASEARAGLKEA
jgi:O-antigen/teichoic acid export membrane protein